jgi:surfeit locus 1 family protein
VQKTPVEIRPRDVIGSIAVLLIAALCVRLGVWQLHRLQQKRDRNAAIVRQTAAPLLRLNALTLDSSDILFRRAAVSGVYDNEHTIVLAGRSLNGAPGVYVLTPLRVGNAGILVNRGWLPSSDAANADIAHAIEATPDTVYGVIVEFSRDPRTDRDSSTAFRKVWYHLNHDAAQQKFPYPIANYIVQITPGKGDPELPRRVPLPTLDEGPHKGYAIQWFSFALIGIVGWLVLLIRSRK